MKECRTNLDETGSALGEAISSRDSCLIALQTKQTELEKYTALNDRTSDYKILQTKLNETLGLLALKDIDIQEGLKTKTYEILVVNQKHDELVKKSLLNRSQFEGQLKEKILKDSLNLKARLYEISHIDTSDPANRFCPNGEETVTLEKESRSKLDKDKVKPYDYTYQNSLYETFKPPSKTYLDQLEHASREVRKICEKMFVRTKPNIAKNVAFLPISKSISKIAFPTPTAKVMACDLGRLILEKEIDELESEKAIFQTYMIYFSKIKECECLAQKLSKQTESVNNEVHNKLLKSFAKLKTLDSPLELSLQIVKNR
ncbi:hypothetical protein Tco_1155636 [Tanacetum coccineum]